VDLSSYADPFVDWSCAVRLTLPINETDEIIGQLSQRCRLNGWLDAKPVAERL
jgi:hypothetical protein